MSRVIAELSLFFPFLPLHFIYCERVTMASGASGIPAQSARNWPQFAGESGG
jgi:hypothetical protein